MRDKPWIIRTYAGHSTAKESNELYRKNLAKGQTGLSVAFDLPTQTGYDADHPLAAGEVGKVGVSICHLGDMRALFDQIPLASMNTSTSRVRRARTCRAPPRTTSSRNISRAAPTCFRRRPRCGSPGT
jgi:methylmalonyl-CoA mutase N-terminal domain/subunit